jgi:N-acetyl-anhydromuramyl-L-alanine amidase AmpD
MVKFGDRGKDVSDIQKNLSIIGYDLIIDGHFGDITLDVVKDFQTKNNLTPDGIVDLKTLEVLNKLEKPRELAYSTKLSSAKCSELDIITSNKLPDNQYIQQITDKSEIYIHFTAGGSNALNTINYWNSDESRIATAYIIDGRESADLYQAFHPDFWSYHLGVKGTNGKLDKISIGIEICAYGPLIKKGDDYFAWPNNYNTKVDKKNVYELEKEFRGYKYFFKYTDKQIENLEKLLNHLILKYKIKIEKSYDNNWFEFNQKVIDDSLPGIWSHTTVRKDKSDTYPDKRILEILNRLSKKYN